MRYRPAIDLDDPYTCPEPKRGQWVRVNGMLGRWVARPNASSVWIAFGRGPFGAAPHKRFSPLVAAWRAGNAASQSRESVAC